MASHSVSAMGMICVPALFLVLLDVVASAHVTSQPDRCSWMRMRECYLRLGLKNAFGSFNQGLQINQKIFTEMCTKMTLPSPCYGELSVCPAEVKANLSSFEEGYKQLRDIHCDKNAYRDSLKIESCLDQMLFTACLQNHLLANFEQPKIDICRNFKTAINCGEEVFPKSCPADYKAVTASFKRSVNAIMLINGCEPSSQAAIVPMNFTIGLVMFIILMRLKAT
ncbi:uncharacterized protein LOC144104062 [Amblyomma americanum]